MSDTLTFLQLLTEAGQLVELRALQMPGEARLGGNNQSGFYTDLAELASNAKRLTQLGARGVYVTLNPIGPGRQLSACGPARIGDSTSDDQISSRRWLLLDLEARRTDKKEAATEAELANARETLLDVIEARQADGWPAPLVTMSGNGWHALWRVDLPNDARSHELVKGCLQALAQAHDGPDAEIDQCVHNAARIVKLPGTWSRKGRGTPERPHRLAAVRAIPPEGLLPVPRALLEDLAARVPTEALPPALAPLPGPSQTESRPGAFDRARAWIAKRPGAMQGQRGSEHTFRTAARLMRGYALSEEDAWQLFARWNQTCVPPWKENELRQRLLQGFRDGKEPIGGCLEVDRPSFRYTPKEAAHRAQVSEPTIRRAIKSGALRAEQVETRFGPSYQVAEADLRAWRATQTPDQETPDQPLIKTPDQAPDRPLIKPDDQGSATPDHPLDDQGLKPEEPPVKTLQKTSNKPRAWDTSEDVPANLPKITKSADLPRMTRLAMEALNEQNERRLRVLKRGDVICRYEVTQGGEPKLRPCNEKMIRGMLARASTWWKKEKNKDGWTEIQILPPKDVCEDMTTLDPEKWPFPFVTRVVRRPILTPDGQLVATEGYHADAQVLYKPLPGWTMPDVPENPAQEEIEAARALILDEALVDFPFVDEASKAHALAAALQPTARAFITGPTPLWLFDASTPGSGKTLLAEVLLQIGSGCTPAKISAPRNDNQDEWQKKITSTLMNAPDAILLDNLSKKLDCPPMADVLTSTYWEDRLLGGNVSVRLDNVGQWVATANNLELSDELTRRTILCRIDAGTARPEERSGFRHSPLKPWISANLGRLTWATLVLVRAWFVRGCPAWQPVAPTKVLGSYESWSHVLGGILDVAGVPGFLANRTAIQERAGGVEDEWVQFFRHWYHEFGCSSVLAKELVPGVLASQLLTGLIKTSDDRAMGQALGNALRSRIGRISSGLRLDQAGKHRSGVTQYKLVIVNAAEVDPDGPPVNVPESKEPAGLF